MTGEIEIGNISSADISGIVATVQNASANITIQIDVQPELGSLTSKSFSYTVTASDDSVSENEPDVLFTSNEGAEASLIFKIYITPGKPKLIAKPGYLESGMLRGNQKMIECEISNIGGAPANNLQVMIPNAPWLKLATSKHIDTLIPGGKAKIELLLNPDSDLLLGPYEGDILVAGDNTNLHIGFQFMAVSEAKGDLKVTVTDEFTYFADDKPNVAGASVTLKDAFEGKVITEGITDGNGIFLAEGIAEGHYKLEVKAEKHRAYNSTIEIIPGQVKDLKAFLSRQFVTYSWSVVPVELEDNYKVTLEAEFETHVPAPVVTVEPRIQVVPFFEGEIGTVEVTITNHGLIEAYGVTLDFDENEEYYVVPLIREIGLLPAMSSIVVPVKVRAKVDGPIEDLPQITKDNVISRKTNGSRIKTSSFKSNRSPLLPDTCYILKGGVFYYYWCFGNQVHKIPLSLKPVRELLKTVDAAKKCLQLNVKDCASFGCNLVGYIDEDIGKTCDNGLEIIKCSTGDVMDCIKALCKAGFGPDSCACKLVPPYGPDSLIGLAECIACWEPPFYDPIYAKDDNFGDGGYMDSGYNQFYHPGYSGGSYSGSNPDYYTPQIWPPPAIPTVNNHPCDDEDFRKKSAIKFGPALFRAKTATKTKSDISKYGGRIMKYKIIGGM